MAMFVVNGTVPIDPVHRDEAQELFAEIAEESREESGIIDYRVAMDVDEPSRFRFIEQYEDDDAFEEHMETEHIQEFMNKLPELVAGDIDATRFNVESSAELDF